MVVNNEQPIFVSSDNIIAGYGSPCVRDLASGVDGSLWALDCEADEEGNY